jgi:2-polyprenyl-3-methyl-5-hydroxy-6-metoxy-1,4-benzoquinol methylase
MKYRERIYSNYVDAASAALAPESVEGLASRSPVLSRFIAAHFPSARQAAILDLGCGHGALLYFARRAGYTNVSGIDGSPAQIEAARRLEIDGVKAGEILPMLRAAPANSLDAVIAYDVIEHLTKDELIDVTDEVFRTLKPGGRWIVHAPNGLSPFCGVMAYGDLTHEMAFTPESLTQLFLSGGFKSATFHEDPPAVRGPKSFVRAVLWRLIRQIYRAALVIETGMTDYRVFTINLTAVAMK